MVPHEGYDLVIQTRGNIIALLPLHKSPLQVRFWGPFTVLEKINDVDYIVSTPVRLKSKLLCRINMLKPYHDRHGQDPDGGKPTTIVVLLKHECIQEPNGGYKDKEVTALKIQIF